MNIQHMTPVFAYYRVINWTVSRDEWPGFLRRYKVGFNLSLVQERVECEYPRYDYKIIRECLQLSGHYFFQQVEYRASEYSYSLTVRISLTVYTIIRALKNQQPLILAEKPKASQFSQKYIFRQKCHFYQKLRLSNTRW